MTVVAVAGWLFADLLLAFSIVMLGTEEPLPAPEPSATPSPSPTQTRRALERTYVTVRLSVSPAAAARGAKSAIRALRAAIRGHPELKARQAGIVLTFGAEFSGGERFARNVNKLLPQVDEDLFGDVATRNLKITKTGGGAVELQIYLFHDG